MLVPKVIIVLFENLGCHFLVTRPLNRWMGKHVLIMDMVVRVPGIWNLDVLGLVISNSWSWKSHLDREKIWESFNWRSRLCNYLWMHVCLWGSVWGLPVSIVRLMCVSTWGITSDVCKHLLNRRKVGISPSQREVQVSPLRSGREKSYKDSP